MWKNHVSLRRCVCSEMLEGMLEYFSHFKFNTMSWISIYLFINKCVSSTFQVLWTILIAGDAVVNKTDQNQPCLHGVCLLRNLLSLKHKLSKKTYYTFCPVSLGKKKSLQYSLSCLCCNFNVTICSKKKHERNSLGNVSLKRSPYSADRKDCVW